MEYTTEQLSDLCANKQPKTEVKTESDTVTVKETEDSKVDIETLNTEVGPDGSIKIVPVTKTETVETTKSNTGKESKFKCGYCSFSADLRVKVKMHCSKKHSEKVINIIEPSAKQNTTVKQENVDLDVDDWKGTKFEQDLRKAGVAKLNLASLFPHSKRFHKSNNSHSVVKVEQDSSEFKKPLEPIAKVKNQDRKYDAVVVKEEATDIPEQTINSDSKTIDNQESTKKSGENFKRDTNTAKSNILISDVRSLKQETAPHIKTEDTMDESVQNQEKEFTIKLEKVQTAFPNHTTVILEDETNDEDLNRNENECDFDTLEAHEDKDVDVENPENIHEENDCNGNSAGCLDKVDKEVIKEEKVDCVTEYDEEYASEKGTKQDSCETDNDKKMHKNTEQKVDKSSTFEKDGIHLMNGHKFSIDGTIKDNYELEDTDIVMKEIKHKSFDKVKSNEVLMKLDGTSDEQLEASMTAGIDGLKNAVIDLPDNNDNTCAITDIYKET